MTLTEIDAAGKWCPFARGMAGADGRFTGINRHPEGIPQNVRCLASYCMAWRWDDTGQGSRTGERRGYCGLAGDPVIVTGVAL